MDSNSSLLNYDISSPIQPDLYGIIRALEHRIMMLENTVHHLLVAQPNPNIDTLGARPTNMTSAYNLNTFGFTPLPPHPLLPGPGPSRRDVAYGPHNMHGPQYSQGFEVSKTNNNHPAVSGHWGHNTTRTAIPPANTYNHHQGDTAHVPYYGGHQFPPIFSVGVPAGQQQSQGYEDGVTTGGAHHVVQNL